VRGLRQSDVSLRDISRHQRTNRHDFDSEECHGTSIRCWEMSGVVFQDLVQRFDILCAVASYGFPLDVSLSIFGFARGCFTQYIRTETDVNVAWRNGGFSNWHVAKA
jgi:hypothetical protein